MPTRVDSVLMGEAIAAMAWTCSMSSSSDYRVGVFAQ